MLRKIGIYLFSIYGILLFTAIMILLGPFVIIISFFGKAGGGTAFRLVKLWGWLFTVFAFIPVRIVRSEKVKKKHSYMYVSNHTSFLDAVTIIQGLPGTIRPLGKKELKSIPLLGAVISRFAVFVDRKNKESRKKSIDAMIAASEIGDSMLIFPEGTMNRTTEPLQSFYEGAYRIAQDANLEIVPVAILNAGKLLPPGKFDLKPGRVTIVVGEPITSSQFSVEELKEMTYQWILQQVTNQ